MLLRLALQRGKFLDGVGQLRLTDEVAIGEPPQLVALQFIHGVERGLKRLDCLSVSAGLGTVQRVAGQVEGVLQNAAVV
jgi:hypothetical protein